MAKLSYINTGVLEKDQSNIVIPTDESIGCFLFDISGFDNPFEGYPLLYSYFKDSQVQQINNLDEGSLIGITDDGFLNGMLYYHLSQFYKHIGEDQSVFIAIADCSENFDIIQTIQQESNGKVFQVGVWTTQPIWNLKTDGKMGFTSLLKELQAQADEVNGKIGESSHRLTPISIVLSGNSNYLDGNTEIDYKSLPDATELECPKVSVALVQNSSPEILKLQSSNPYQSPVGSIGLIMALLSSIGVEESLGSVEHCDLNINEEFNYPSWGFGSDGTPIDTLHRLWANIITTRGYIVPIDYEGEEASYFLTNDQTLSTGDFSTIANNRVMHKCRRAMGTALMPYVNSNQIYEPGSKNISLSAQSMISSSVYTILDSVMRNKNGDKQIDGRVLEFEDNEDMLDNESLRLKLTIQPVNYSTAISEEVSHDISG